MDKHSTISLDEDGDNFILKRTDSDGTTSNIILSPQNVMTFAQSAPLFQERILSRIHPSGGDFSAVFVTPVAQIGLHDDALRENILLTLVAPNGARLVYQLDPSLAQELAVRIPIRLEEMRSRKPTA